MRALLLACFIAVHVHVEVVYVSSFTDAEWAFTEGVHARCAACAWEERAGAAPDEGRYPAVEAGGVLLAGASGGTRAPAAAAVAVRRLLRVPAGAVPPVGDPVYA